MEQINYEDLIPTQPEEDVVAFAFDQGAFREHYLVYQSAQDMVEVTCSACGEQFYAEKVKAGGCSRGYASAPFGWYNDFTKKPVISGQTTVCPSCLGEAETVHVGNMRLYNGEVVDDDFVTVLSRLPMDGRIDRLVVTDWCVRRCVNKQAETRYEVWPFAAWVVEETKITRLMGYTKYMGNISLFGHWKQRKAFVNIQGGTGMVMPWEPSLLTGTTAENCKLDLYQKAGGTQLAAYLALWRRRPAVENLLVQGCGKLVSAWIDAEMQFQSYTSSPSKGIPKLTEVNWKEKRPAQMLGLNKEEFRHLQRMRWDTDDLERYKTVRDAGYPVKLPNDMELLRTVRTYELNRILEEVPNGELWRVLRYLSRQKEDWSTLRDYWRMAREDGRDLNDSLVRWPRDLSVSHARQIEKRRVIAARKEAAAKAKRMAARAPLFQARAEVLSRLSFTLDGLLIRPCANEDELITEGNFLHHCVANYAQNHASGGTAIFFIRKADKPEEPYFTLEFDEEKLEVRQNRGLRNCARTPEVEAFEAAWLAWVKTTGAAAGRPQGSEGAAQATMKKARVRVA